uniref:Solute carrier family 2 member 13b n=1 Tax=Oryzias sinensis TaxID=183150 RepID=A0A8C8DI31_9TELE
MGRKRQRAADGGERSLIGPSSSGASGNAEEERDTSTRGFVYVLAFFSALGGFLFGYDTGVVSGAMLLLKKRMNLSALWQELLVSSTVGAAAVSALAGGFLNGWLGRRICILLASFIFSVGGVTLALAPDKVVLLVGRIIVGLGIGIASMTVPVYIAEVSPPHLRGQLVTVNALFITGGQFIASMVDGAFSYLSEDGWRYMLGLSVLPAVLQFLGFIFLPESPRWLLQKGQNQEALHVLRWIRGDQNVEEEYDSIKANIEEEGKEVGAGGVVLFRMLSHGPTRRALIVGCGLQMFQQLSGINTVMYYSATILQMAGVRDDKEAIWLAAATSAINFVFTLVGVWLVERVGRRKLTLGSLLGTGLSLALLAVGFLLSAQSSPPVTLHPVDPNNSTCRLYGSCEPCMLDPDCGFCFRENGTKVFESSCVPVHQASIDHAAWGRSELLFHSSIQKVYLELFFWSHSRHVHACLAGAFFLYTGLVFLGLLFVLGCLPETRGLQLEDMENLFMGQLCSCGASSPTHNRHVHYIRPSPGCSSAQYGALDSDGAIAYITVSTALRCF